MMKEYEVIVIGGGPGGYATATKASLMGKKTALIERDMVGGTCVHWGCIPTKTMLRHAKLLVKKAMQKTYDYIYEDVETEFDKIYQKTYEISQRQGKRIEQVLADSSVDVYEGTGHLCGNMEVEILPSGEKIKGENIVIATGSTSRQLDNVEYDGETIMTTKDVVKRNSVPASAVVIGSGASGMEYATIWNRFGSKVTIMEVLPHILPNEDTDVSVEIENQLLDAGLDVITGVDVKCVVKTDDGARVVYEIDGTEKYIDVESVLVSVGIVPVSDGLGMEEIGVETDEHGYVIVNEKMQTSVPGIYAVGDIIGKLPLAVTASLESDVIVEDICGIESEDIDYDAIPRCIYSAVEIGAVGLTEKKAIEKGANVGVIKVPLNDLSTPGKLRAEKGFIKFVIDKDTNKLLGAHVVGDNAADLITGPASMVATGAVIEEAENCCVG